MCSDIYNGIDYIDQGLAHFFCKWPDHKYFQLSGPCGLYHNYSTLPLFKKADRAKQKLDMTMSQ